MRREILLVCSEWEYRGGEELGEDVGGAYLWGPKLVSRGG